MGQVLTGEAARQRWGVLLNQVDAAHREMRALVACGPDHTALTEGRWNTTVTDTGRLTWANSQTPLRINHVHHPDELLYGDPDPAPATSS